MQENSNIQQHQLSWMLNMKKISGKTKVFFVFYLIFPTKSRQKLSDVNMEKLKKRFLNGVRYQKGPLFLCWSQELCHLTRNLSQIERTKKMFLQLLSNWQNGNYFNSKWQLEWNRFRAFAQLVTTVIFFSAWNKSSIKWDNSRNLTQKMRT